MDQRYSFADRFGINTSPNGTLFHSGSWKTKRLSRSGISFDIRCQLLDHRVKDDSISYSRFVVSESIRCDGVPVDKHGYLSLRVLLHCFCKPW